MGTRGGSGRRKNRSMKPRARLLILIACLVAVPLIAASLQSQVHAQSGPFPTVPPPNATFQPPIQVGPTAQPGFVPVDLRPELGLGARLRKAAGYMVAGAASLALGVTALWANRQRAKGASVLGPGGVAWSGPKEVQLPPAAAQAALDYPLRGRPRPSWLGRDEMRSAQSLLCKCRRG